MLDDRLLQESKELLMARASFSGKCLQEIVRYEWYYRTFDMYITLSDSLKELEKFPREKVIEISKKLCEQGLQSLRLLIEGLNSGLKH